MVNTKRLKKIDLNSGGMTKVPNCPRATAATRMHAVVPSENPLNLIRPRTVPTAIARRMKISGVVAMIDPIVLIAADSPASNPLGPRLRPAEPEGLDSDQYHRPVGDHSVLALIHWNGNQPECRCSRSPRHLSPAMRRCISQACWRSREDISRPMPG